MDAFAETAALTVSPQEVYLSPVHPTASVDVVSTRPYTVEDSNVATASAASGNAGNTSVTFTRKSSPTDFSVYGNDTVTFKAVGKNQKADVKVCNLFLSAPDSIWVPNPQSADTAVTIKSILPFGGDADYVIDGYTSDGNWISDIQYTPGSSEMKITASHNDTYGSRKGNVTVHHVNDPDYKITVPIVQDEFIYIPAFKYFVLDVQWCKRDNLDIDIAFLFRNNNPATPFEDLPVGFGYLINDPNLTNRPSNWNSIYKRSSTASVVGGLGVLYHNAVRDTTYNLINWGGDAVVGQGESVYFDADAFDEANDIPRFLKMDLYLNWFKHGHSDEPWTVRVTVSCYKGGVMQKYCSIPSLTSDAAKTNYKNVGGTPVYTHSFFIDLKHEASTQVDNRFTTKYTYASIIEYDCVSHSARIKETDPSHPKWSHDAPLCSNGSDIYNFRLSEEEEARILKAKQKTASQLYK